MEYYTRLLTPSTKTVTLKEIFDHLTKNNVKFFSNIKNDDKKVDDKNWNQVELWYDKKKSPIILEKNVLDDTKDNLVKSEITEFLDEINKLPFSISKTRVKFKLRKINQIFAFRIPTSDITEKGWELRDGVDNFFSIFLLLGQDLYIFLSF